MGNFEARISELFDKALTARISSSAGLSPERKREAIDLFLGVAEFFTQDLSDFLVAQPLAFELTNLGYE